MATYFLLLNSVAFSWLRIEFGVPSPCHVVCVVNPILHNHMLGAELIVPVDKTSPPVLRANILDGSQGLTESSGDASMTFIVHLRKM